MQTETIQFADVAARAGFTPGPDGRLNIPATQESADALTKAAGEHLDWQPGLDPITVVLTGAGPVWGYLCVAHGLHGRAAVLQYAAPNAPLITVWRHGV